MVHGSSKALIQAGGLVAEGVKVDANPGEGTTTGTAPNRLGSYVVRGAELCGVLHAQMETKADVVSGNDFAAWIQAREGERP